MPEVDMYCINCKRSVPVKDPVHTSVTGKHGTRHMLKGTCPAGHKVNKFIKPGV